MKKPFILLFKLLFHPIIRLFILKQVVGRERVPKENNFLIVANHIDSLDHFLLGSVFKERIDRLCFVARKKKHWELWRIILDYLADPIVVERGKVNWEDFLHKVKSEIQKGKIIVVYPEGDTNKSKQLLKGKRGVGKILQATKLMALPIGIRELRFFQREIYIGEPLQFKDTDKVDTIVEKIMMVLSSLSGKKYLNDY